MGSHTTIKEGKVERTNTSLNWDNLGEYPVGKIGGDNFKKGFLEVTEDGHLVKLCINPFEYRYIRAVGHDMGMPQFLLGSTIQ